MTEAARVLLTAFETLPPADQLEVVAEILRRTSGVGELAEEGLCELSGELFRGYDVEEADHAAS